MKYVFLVFMNIKKFITKHTALFLMLILVQIICCVAAFISCGMANNLFFVEEKVEEPSEFSFSFETNEEVEGMGVVKKYSDSGEFIDAYYVPEGAPIDDENFKTYTMEHKYVVSMGEARPKLNEFVEYMKQYDITDVELLLYYNKITDLRVAPMEFMSYIPFDGANVSIDEIYFKTDEKIILAPVYDENGDEVEGEFFKLGERYNINGYEYKCVAPSNNFYIIPYNALDDNFVVACANIYVKDHFTKRQIDDAVDKFNSLFGTNIQDTSTPDPYDPLEMQFNKMIYVIAIVIMIVIILAIAKFYNYILSERLGTLAILRLCGCNRVKTHIIYMLEIIITMIITSAAGALIFKYLVFDYIAYYYPSFIEFYKPHIFIIVLAAYTLLALIIMFFTIIPSTKASIVEMKKKA